MSKSFTAATSSEAAALREVRRRKGFYLHLLPFALVVAGLTVLNLLLTPHYPWVLWVAAGWGIGLTIHAIVTFRRPRLFDAGWERKQVQKILARKS